MRSVSEADLLKAYDLFQNHSNEVSERDFIKWIEVCRLDARLCEILIRFLRTNYHCLNPFKIYQLLKKVSAPQALGVLIEFSKLDSLDKDFDCWSECVLWDLEVNTYQMFFVQSSFPKPQRDMKVIEKSLRPYLRWGFFGDEILAPLKKEKRTLNSSLIPKEKRLKILDRLFIERDKVTVNTYIEACENMIPRRTAERDLKSLPGLKSQGRTRNKFYYK